VLNLKQFSGLMRVLPYLILVAILVYSAYSYYALADSYTQEELERGGKGYVSDEVWYVDAARNILRKIFGAAPRFVGRPSATVIYSGNLSLDKMKSLAEEYGVQIVDSSYTQLKSAVYVEASSAREIELFARGINASDVVWGWRLGDAEGINNYLNLEHPPLVKYLIALFMLLLGDYPTYWRLPSIAAGLLTIILTYMLVTEVSGRWWLGIAAAALLASDPIMKAMSSVAMLDVYVALFTVAAVYTAVKKGPLRGVIVAALGSTAKFNTVFTLLPLYLAYARRLAAQRVDLRKFLDETLFFICFSLLAFVLLQTAVSLPVIAALGPARWMDQCIVGALRWHLTTKCVGEGCPPSSAPWAWFFNINSFPLYYFDQGAVTAHVNIFLLPLALVLAMVAAPAYALDRGSRWSIGLFWGILLGYVALWFLGNRSQYSFYAVQLAPFTYSLLVTVVANVVVYRSRVLCAVLLWRRGFEGLWAMLTKLLLPEYTCERVGLCGGAENARSERAGEGSGEPAEGSEGEERG